MSAIQAFFEVTRRELNNMVTWRDGAPVAEFWEMFDRAALEAESAELHKYMSDSDDNPANSELAQLRAEAKEARDAHVYLDESFVNDQDAPPLDLADRCAALVNQVMQLRADLQVARSVIVAYRALPTGPKGYTSMPLFDLHNAADAWLAANAPAPGGNG